MVTEYFISEKDYIECGILNSDMNNRTKYTNYCIVLLLIVVGAISYYAYHRLIGFSMIGAGVSALLIPDLIRMFLLPFLLKSRYRKYPLIKETIRIDLEEDGIKYTSDDGNNLIRWKYIYGWRENNNFILIYLAPKLYQIIPKRIVKNNFPLANLISKLKTHIGNAI